MTIDILLLVALAGAATRIGALQRRVRDLEGQAITDPLTGAFNRRQMHRALAMAIERRHRSSERASLLLFDIDRFKHINDTLGHAEGDRILKALVVLIDQRLRKLDALFRLGGEEFVLLLSGAKIADALSVAEDLRRLVQDALLAPGCPVSISIGVAELAHEQSVSEWIAEADRALYRAKGAGRNRVAGRWGDPAGLNDNRLPFPALIS
jgi:diguanylate cyclase (GGDEF)-like protein